VLAAVAACREFGAPVLSRAPARAWRAVLQRGGHPRFSRHLNGILAIDPDRRQARVQPGVVLEPAPRRQQSASA